MPSQLISCLLINRFVVISSLGLLGIPSQFTYLLETAILTDRLKGKDGPYTEGRLLQARPLVYTVRLS